MEEKTVFILCVNVFIILLFFEINNITLCAEPIFFIFHIFCVEFTFFVCRRPLPLGSPLAQREHALRVEGERDRVDVRDLVAAVALARGRRAPLRPVLVALDAALLHHVGDHAHDAAVLLPHHAPEVGERVGHGTCQNCITV